LLCNYAIFKKQLNKNEQHIKFASRNSTAQHILTLTQPFAKFSKALFILILITFCWGGKVKAQTIYVSNYTTTKVDIYLNFGTNCTSNTNCLSGPYTISPGLTTLPSNVFCYPQLLRAMIGNNGPISDGQVANDLECSNLVGYDCGQFPNPIPPPNFMNESVVVVPGYKIYIAQVPNFIYCPSNPNGVSGNATITDYEIVIGN
jgi:hypothetical protein